MKRVVVAGAGNIGFRLAKALEERMQVKLIERNPDRARRAAETLRNTLVLAGDAADEDWHSGKYAALVIGTCRDQGTVHPRALQLLREFLVADKPVAVFGDGLRALEEAGGLPDDAVLSGQSADDGFVDRLVSAFSDRLDEAQVDEMSDQSFPASDPPAITPTSAGPSASPEGRM